MKRLKPLTQAPVRAASIPVEVKMTFISQFIGITTPLVQGKDQVNA